MLQRTATTLVLVLAACATAAAQEPALCPDSAATALAGAERAPDIVIRASARAREVRFESRPSVRATLPGCARLDTVRVLERRNLPDPVRPGVTYRDVFVAVEILGYLDVECLLRDLAIPTVRDSTAAGMLSAPALRCAGLGRGNPPRRER